MGWVQGCLSLRLASSRVKTWKSGVVQLISCVFERATTLKGPKKLLEMAGSWIECFCGTHRISHFFFFESKLLRLTAPEKKTDSLLSIAYVPFHYCFFKCFLSISNFQNTDILQRHLRLNINITKIKSGFNFPGGVINFYFWNLKFTKSINYPFTTLLTETTFFTKKRRRKSNFPSCKLQVPNNSRKRMSADKLRKKNEGWKSSFRPIECLHYHKLQSQWSKRHYFAETYVYNEDSYVSAE